VFGSISFFAKRLGLKNTGTMSANLDYGNKQIGDNVTTFWLEGPFGISAREQVDFLRKLVLGKLPFPQNNIDLLKKS